MFHDRGGNAKLNMVFERALRIACNDSGNNSVNNYYNLNKSLPINQPNLQLHMIEMFKRMNTLNPTFIKDFFAERIAVIACEI